MEKDSTSFWADIKKYEDTLARDPNSYCFAPLSEVYRRLGLLDDAISTASRGVEIHPEYVGGYMALGRAYHEKGMRREARESLEKVARATPENLLAQKLLSQIFLEEGNILAAEKALNLLISFNPEDTESRLALEALQRGKSSRGGTELVLGESAGAAHAEADVDSTEGDAGLGIMEREGVELSTSIEHQADDQIQDYDFSFDDQDDSSAPVPGEDEGESAPLSTLTLAELYEAQGYHEKAMAVYRELLTNDPESPELGRRVALLQARTESVRGAVSLATATDLYEDIRPEQFPGAVPPSGACPEKCEAEISRPVSREEVVETLEKWLVSIRRERACP